MHIEIDSLQTIHVYHAYVTEILATVNGYI